MINVVVGKEAGAEGARWVERHEGEENIEQVELLLRAGGHSGADDDGAGIGVAVADRGDDHLRYGARRSSSSVANVSSGTIRTLEGRAGTSACATVCCRSPS